MSEGEGIDKLRAYLQQTRRQAELSIESLTNQISFLTAENEELKDTIEQLSLEKKELKQIAEKLKLENSKKWRFQERDDWKCLVESLQTDRSRLQDENGLINRNLELEKEKVLHLEDEINKLTSEIEKLRHTVNNSSSEHHDVLANVMNDPLDSSRSNHVAFSSPLMTPHKDLKINVTDDDNIENNVSSPMEHSIESPVATESPDANERLKKLQTLTPRAASNVLHFELEKVHRKVSLLYYANDNYIP